MRGNWRGKVRTRGRKTKGPAAVGRRASPGEADRAGAGRSAARTAAVGPAQGSSLGRTATARGSARPARRQPAAVGTGTHRRKGTAAAEVAGTGAGTAGTAAAGAARCRRRSPSLAQSPTCFSIQSRGLAWNEGGAEAKESWVATTNPRRWNLEVELGKSVRGPDRRQQEGNTVVGWRSSAGGRWIDRSDPPRGRPCGFRC
jgi:hypothetical protein